MNNLPAKKSRIPANEGLDASVRLARMRTWLESFAQLGNIRLACLHAGIHRNTYYWWMDRSSAENPPAEYCVDGVPFAQLAEVAADEAADILEREALRRAVDGVEDPVYGTLGTPELVEGKNGEEREIVRKYTGVVGSRKVYSDRLLEILLKARRPHVFRENIRVEGQVEQVHVLDESSRDRLAAKLQDAIDRRLAASSLAGLAVGGSPTEPGVILTPKVIFEGPEEQGAQITVVDGECVDSQNP